MSSVKVESKTVIEKVVLEMTEREARALGKLLGGTSRKSRKETFGLEAKDAEDVGVIYWNLCDALSNRGDTL